MHRDSKIELSIACLRLLRPLARIMLRHGLSTYDFSRIANIAFVRAAGDILREQGKPVSFSRVSAITGLHRHVVSDIVNSPELWRSDTRRQGLPPQPPGAGPYRLVREPALHRWEGRRWSLALGRTASVVCVTGPRFSGDIYPESSSTSCGKSARFALQKDGSIRALSVAISAAVRRPRLSSISATCARRLQHARAQSGQPSRTATLRRHRCLASSRSRRAATLSAVAASSAARRSSRTSKVGLQSTRRPTQGWSARRRDCTDVRRRRRAGEVRGACRLAERMISASGPPARGTRLRPGA